MEFGLDVDLRSACHSNERLAKAVLERGEAGHRRPAAHVHLRRHRLLEDVQQVQPGAECVAESQRMAHCTLRVTGYTTLTEQGAAMTPGDALPLPPDRQHGSRRKTHDFFRYAAHQGVAEPAPPVRAHHDHVRVDLVGVLQNHRRRRHAAPLGPDDLQLTGRAIVQLTGHAALGRLLQAPPYLFRVRKMMGGIVRVVGVQDDRVQHVEHRSVLPGDRERVIQRRISQLREVRGEEHGLQ